MIRYSLRHLRPVIIRRRLRWRHRYRDYSPGGPSQRRCEDLGAGTDAEIVTVWDPTARLRRVELLMKLHLRATGCHLQYGGHTMLPATRQKWTHPALTPARGRYSIYLPSTACILASFRLKERDSICVGMPIIIFYNSQAIGLLYSRIDHSVV